MLKYFRFVSIMMSVLIVNTNANAQQIMGKPLTGIKGVTKTVAEITAFSKQQELLKPPTIEAPRPELEMPEELPLPGEKIITYSDVTNSNGNISSRITAASQQIHSNFMATDFSSASGGWPPDNNGDVGTTQVFIAQNFRFVVYPKPSVTAAAVTTPNGTSIALLAAPVMNISQNAFFQTAFASVNAVDPHVRYDRLTNRWFVISMSTNQATNNYLLFAVSSGATISSTSSFTFFRIQLSSFPAGNADIGKFLDYPTLGIDKFSLYLGANIFTSSTGSFSHSSVYVVNKADMIAGTLTITPFPAVGTSGGGSIVTPQGVQNDDPSATEGYFVGTSLAFFSQLVMRKITYSGTTPVLNAENVITVSTNRSPIGQPAFGSSGTLDASNTRLFAGMMMKNKITGLSTLWTAQTVGVISNGTSSTGTNDRNGSRWYEIQNLSTTPAVKQSGTLFNNAATNQRGFWFPGIAMSGQGHSVMAVSSASAVDRIDIVIAGRYSSSATGDLEDSVYATSTTSNYNPLNGGTFMSRWGDYSQVVVDPQDNMTMWAFHQYTNTTNSYGVRAIQLKAPAPPSTNATSAPLGFCSATAAVTITGTIVDNTGFFDPGADVGGPGFNRLTITCSGGVAVSNVAFISPTQVSCTVNTVGKTAGIYTLTITNPDGQTTTAAFTLSSACLLPVRLLQFDGALKNENIALKWKTTQEINLRKYIVEKSFDGINFLEIGSVNALGSTIENMYGFIDKTIYPGNNFYRLKMMDLDGSFRYSEIINIKTALKSIAVTRVYPNPASDNLNIEWISQKEGYININLYASNGSKVISINKKNGIGLNNSIISCKGLSKAIYLLTITDNDGNIIYKKSISIE